jgi:hypothetical protein
MRGPNPNSVCSGAVRCRPIQKGQSNQDTSLHMKTAMARSNASGGEEFEGDAVSPSTISPGFGALEAGWLAEVAILIRRRACSLRASELAERSPGSWRKAPLKFAAVTAMSPQHPRLRRKGPLHIYRASEEGISIEKASIFLVGPMNHPARGSDTFHLSFEPVSLVLENDGF